MYSSLETGKILYKSCVRMRDVNKSFILPVGIRKGCKMSSLLFNTCLDEVVKELKGRFTGKGSALGNSVVKCIDRVKV